MTKRNPKSAGASPTAVAKPPELPPPPSSPQVIQQIPLHLITPSLYQPRRFQIPDAEDPDLLDLARSIRAKGVIQPILLRPVESGFELVVGERRVRASRLTLPELDAIAPAPHYIDAIVRELTDTDAAEITVEENLRRKDLLPLEEADGVHTLLLLHKGDPFAVAARLGQTPAWVACRARLHSNLSPAWKEFLADPDNPLRAWTAGHLEQIAKLAQEVQDEILENAAFENMDPNLTVPELRGYLADLTRTLNRAPFPLDDDTLHPSAGACTHCPLTTLAAPLLFADQDGSPADIKDARCLNRTCWIEKCHRSAERAAAQLRAEHPDLLLVAPRELQPEEIPPAWRGHGQLLQAHAYEKAKKGTEGAQPAMLAGGPQTGRLVWVKPNHPTRPTRPPQPAVPVPEPSTPQAAPIPSRDLLAERRAKHMNRRIARLAELTRQQLEAFDGKSLSSHTLLALARVFGTNHNCKAAWQYGPASEPWAAFDAFRSLSAEDAAAQIWTAQLQPVLASRLQYCGPEDAGRLHAEILAALTLIGVSYPDLYRALAKELPEPKAWTKLPGYQPEDLEGEPPAPLSNVLSVEGQDRPFVEENPGREAIPA